MLLKGQQACPSKIVTDKLKSYSAARREVMSTVPHCTTRYANNSEQERRVVSEANSEQERRVVTEGNPKGRRQEPPATRRVGDRMSHTIELKDHINVLGDVSGR